MSVLLKVVERTDHMISQESRKWNIHYHRGHEILGDSICFHTHLWSKQSVDIIWYPKSPQKEWKMKQYNRLSQITTRICLHVRSVLQNITQLLKSLLHTETHSKTWKWKTINIY